LYDSITKERGKKEKVVTLYYIFNIYTKKKVNTAYYLPSYGNIYNTKKEYKNE